MLAESLEYCHEISWDTTIIGGFWTASLPTKSMKFKEPRYHLVILVIIFDEVFATISLTLSKHQISKHIFWKIRWGHTTLHRPCCAGWASDLEEAWIHQACSRASWWRGWIRFRLRRECNPGKQAWRGDLGIGSFEFWVYVDAKLKHKHNI